MSLKSDVAALAGSVAALAARLDTAPVNATAPAVAAPLPGWVDDAREAQRIAQAPVKAAKAAPAPRTWKRLGVHESSSGRPCHRYQTATKSGAPFVLIIPDDLLAALGVVKP